MNPLLSEILNDGLQAAIRNAPSILSEVGSKEGLIQALELAGESWLAQELKRLYDLVETHAGPAAANNHAWNK